MVQLHEQEQHDSTIGSDHSNSLLSQSGDKEVAKKITLTQVQELSIHFNILKENAPIEGSAAQRANVVEFFKAYGANSFTQFKKVFGKMKLHPPGEKKPEFYSLIDLSSEAEENNNTPQQRELDVDKKEITEEEIKESKPIYDENFESYQTSLQWKYVKRPGGMAIRPPAWYKLQGAVSQVEKGDNETERPMWTEDGSVDYGGKESWEAWSKYKGRSVDECKVLFVRTLQAAKDNKKENFYK